MWNWPGTLIKPDNLQDVLKAALKLFFDQQCHPDFSNVIDIDGIANTDVFIVVPECNIDELETGLSSFAVKICQFDHNVDICDSHLDCQRQRSAE